MPTKLTANAAPISFKHCALTAISNPEFVAEYNRLTGRNIGQRESRSAIERLVDAATGYNAQEDDLWAFAAFVYDVVWLRLDPALRDPQDAVALKIEGGLN